MIYANYDEYEKTNRKAYDKFNKGKIFYAFNLEQLKEGMESIGLNLKETKKLAYAFSKLLKGGETILLSGDLGAGKTTFTKFVLQALGVKDNITSPTFTLMHEYNTKRFTIYHFDMYRLSSGAEATEIGIEDYLYSGNPNTIVFVEWADNIKDILHGNFIRINIGFIDENKRKFEIIR